MSISFLDAYSLLVFRIEIQFNFTLCVVQFDFLKYSNLKLYDKNAFCSA